MAKDDKNIYYVPEGSKVSPHIYDKRVVQKNLNSGKAERAEFEKYLQELPDDADNCDTMNFGDIVNDSGETSPPEDDYLAVNIEKDTTGGFPQ